MSISLKNYTFNLITQYFLKITRVFFTLQIEWRFGYCNEKTIIYKFIDLNLVVKIDCFSELTLDFRCIEYVLFHTVSIVFILQCA